MNLKDKFGPARLGGLMQSNYYDLKASRAKLWQTNQGLESEFTFKW